MSAVWPLPGLLVCKMKAQITLGQISEVLRTPDLKVFLPLPICLVENKERGIVGEKVHREPRAVGRWRWDASAAFVGEGPDCG